MFNDTQFKIIFEYLKKRYGNHIGEGRHRITFESKYCVIKLPHNSAGYLANLYEAKLYKTDIYIRHRLAKCKIVYFGDFAILVMQKLNTNWHWTEMPSWSKHYDCQQVGTTRQGEWKAYDYGY